MKNLNSIITILLLAFSSITLYGQKITAPVQKGPYVMPANTQTVIIRGGISQEKYLKELENLVTFKFDSSYNNADVYIKENGKNILMYKAKLDDKRVNQKLKSRIYNTKIYTLDGKTLLFMFESEVAVSNKIKVVTSVPDNKPVIYDFSNFFKDDDYNMFKSETFEKYPIHVYYRMYNKK